MPAMMVTRCRYYQVGPLRICDTQILSIDQAGARQFGYEHPRALVGMHMSDLQSPAWREAGHRRYLDRKLGKPLGPDYVVMIQRPDGEEIAQRREFGGFMCGKERGEDIYLTYLEHVTHCEEPPSLRALNPAEMRMATHYSGDGTVAALRSMLEHPSTIPLALQDTVLHIIKECVELSSGLFAGKYHTWLDLALSDDVAVSWYGRSRERDATSLVRARFACDWCGFVWYGRSKQRAQCPATGCRRVYRGYRRR